MNAIKAIVKKIPGISSLANMAAREQAFLQLTQSTEKIDQRLKRKVQNGEKIQVLFVCHRPPVWESLHSVYDALRADDRFSATIVAVPNKKELPETYMDHEVYESEGAEEFWKEYRCINGYNYETKEWFDLKTLEPDYIFFQQPYNVARPPEYQSRVVSRYAKLGYVAYFSPISLDDTYDESTPLDFLKDLSFFFTQHQDDDAFIKNRFKSIPKNICRIVQTGCPRFDHIGTYEGSECEIWNQNKTFKMIWTPRWTTNEGNCHFFTYKDNLIDYCMNHPETELVFRPHPQAFREWAATGEMNPDEQETFRALFREGSMHLDESKNYYPLIFSSDCLITDRSTMIVDYLCTKKPIIYCTSNGIHDEVISGLEKSLYKVGSWDELRKTLENLKAGNDPLKDAREDVYSHYLQIGKHQAAERIKEALLEDALK